MGRFAQNTPPPSTFKIVDHEVTRYENSSHFGFDFPSKRHRKCYKKRKECLELTTSKWGYCCCHAYEDANVPTTPIIQELEDDDEVLDVNNNNLDQHHYMHDQDEDVDEVDGLVDLRHVKKQPLLTSTPQHQQPQLQSCGGGEDDSELGRLASSLDELRRYADDNQTPTEDMSAAAHPGHNRPPTPCPSPSSFGRGPTFVKPLPISKLPSTLILPPMSTLLSNTRPPPCTVCIYR